MKIAAVVIARSAGSSFISFACWKTVIGMAYAKIANRKGRFAYRFTLPSADVIFESAAVMKMTVRIPPTWLRKKACGAERNKNPIPVNNCQATVPSRHANPVSAMIFG